MKKVMGIKILMALMQELTISNIDLLKKLLQAKAVSNINFCK